MDKIKNIELKLKVLRGIVQSYLPTMGNVVMNDILHGIDKVENEVLELEKIENYNQASLSPTKSKKTQKEMVNHPSHYQGTMINGQPIECIDIMEATKGWFQTAIFCELNAFKYNWRVGDKDMVPQELGKISWYGNKASELWKENLSWYYPKNGHSYAVIDLGELKMKNPGTGEWVESTLYTDGKGFYVREDKDFASKFVKGEEQ